MVEGARLESEYTAKPYRGFESLPLRHFWSGRAAGRQNSGNEAGILPNRQLMRRINSSRSIGLRITVTVSRASATASSSA